MPIDKLQKLKTLLEVVNQDTFSQKDFLDAFSKVMEIFKAMKEQNSKEMESMKAMIFSMVSEMQKNNTVMVDSSKQKMMDYCMTEMTKMTNDWETMQKKHDSKMQAMDKKMSQVVSGKDADEAKVTKDVLAVLIPQIPKIDDIEKDIPKLGVPIRDSLELLQGKDRLNIKAIDGVEELKKELAIPSGSSKGGWGAHPLTIQQSGTTKAKTARFLNFTGATVTQSAAGVTTIAITGGSTFYTETPTGAINGSNVTYTTVNTITTILNFAINGQYLHPTVDYTFTGSTITMVTALDSTLSGKPFTIIYA